MDRVRIKHSQLFRRLQIYIAFVDTPGFFAGIIRRVIKQKYIHVVLSMDPELEEAYSVGRRNPAVPLLAGFEKEDKRKNDICYFCIYVNFFYFRVDSSTYVVKKGVKSCF